MTLDTENLTLPIMTPMKRFKIIMVPRMIKVTKKTDAEIGEEDDAVQRF